MQPLTLPITNLLSNTHSNQIPQVYFFATNLSKSSCADQYVDSDENSHSYDCTISYITELVVFPGIQFSIRINLSAYDLTAPSTPLNDSSSSVISSITTSFSLCSIDQNGYSLKKTDAITIIKIVT